MKISKPKVIKAFNETIRKYKNPINDPKWIKENYLQYKTCAFCHLYLETKDDWVTTEDHVIGLRCDLCPLGKRRSKCTHEQWYKDIYNAWSYYIAESNDNHKHKEDKNFYINRAFRELKYQLNRAAFYIAELKKEYMK